MALLDVALAPRHILGVLGIHQIDFQALLFENLKHRHPINTRRLHGHAAHAFFHQPAAHLAQIRRKTSEPAYRLGVAIRADGHPMLAATDIDPSGIRMHYFQCFPIHFLLDRPLLFACRLLRPHAFSYFNQGCWTRPGSDS